MDFFSVMAFVWVLHLFTGGSISRSTYTEPTISPKEYQRHKKEAYEKHMESMLRMYGTEEEALKQSKLSSERLNNAKVENTKLKNLVIKDI